jgi:hypothetical protein
MAAVASGICVVRRWIDQSTSFSRIKAVVKFVVRDQRNAFKCLNHANALFSKSYYLRPLSPSLSLNFVTLSSVQIVALVS